MHCCSVLQVLNRIPCRDLPGEALLADCLPLVTQYTQNQALMCLQAQQEMQLGRFEAVLKTVAPFLDGSSDLAPSRWALHLTVHTHWLNGDLDQVCCYLPQNRTAGRDWF